MASMNAGAGNNGKAVYKGSLGVNSGEALGSGSISAEAAPTQSWIGGSTFRPPTIDTALHSAYESRSPRSFSTALSPAAVAAGRNPVNLMMERGFTLPRILDSGVSDPLLARMLFEIADSAVSPVGESLQFDPGLAIALGMHQDDAARFASVWWGSRYSQVPPMPTMPQPRVVWARGVAPAPAIASLWAAPPVPDDKGVLIKWWGVQLPLDKEETKDLADFLEGVNADTGNAAGIANAIARFSKAHPALKMVSDILWALSGVAGLYGKWIREADACKGVNLNWISITFPITTGALPTVTSR